MPWSEQAPNLDSRRERAQIGFKPPEAPGNTQTDVGEAGAREILSGIGISLRAPQTPRPPPPETWRVNIDDVRMEQQLRS